MCSFEDIRAWCICTNIDACIVFLVRVTFHAKEAVEKALKLDRELRINGFLVTVSKYRDEDEQKAHSANANKVLTYKLVNIRLLFIKLTND
jgi:hypothetical protein